MHFEFAIIGTTASGKSDLAINLAQQIKAVILSLDSLCVYKQINIASAKPNADELAQIKHFGVNLVSVDEKFNAADFAKEYKNALKFAQNNDIPLIITGGSGFYLKSLMSGLSPKIPELEQIPSNDQIWQIATKIDPEFCAKFSQNDSFRLKKWYEIYTHTNQTPSIWQKNNTQAPIIKNIKIFDLFWEKDELNQRIFERTKKMILNGLIDEARELFGKFDSNLKPLNSIGLKETKDYLDGKFGEICDDFELLDDKKSAIFRLYEQICTHTIQLAKRQRTFNKSQFKNRIQIKNSEFLLKFKAEFIK